MSSHLTTVAPKHKKPPEFLLVMSLPFLKDLEFNFAGFQPSTDRHKNLHHFSPSFSQNCPFFKYILISLFCPLSLLSECQVHFCKSAHSTFPDHTSAETQGSFLPSTTKKINVVLMPFCPM